MIAMTRRKLKYRPAAHAIERLREYFGVKEIHALDFSNDVMQKAQFVTTQTDGRRLYKNDELDVMVVVAQDNTIITYLPAPEKRREIERTGAPLSTETTPKPNGLFTGDNAFLTSFQTVIQRELTKAQRQFTREYRKLAESIAVIGLEIAQLTLNKARARSPITQGHIQRKIDELHAQAVRMDSEKGELEAQFRAMKSEVSGLIGTGVGV